MNYNIDLLDLVQAYKTYENTTNENDFRDILQQYKGVVKSMYNKNPNESEKDLLDIIISLIDLSSYLLKEK